MERKQKKWFYLSFECPKDAVVNPEDKRIMDRMSLIPFYLMEDARRLGHFIAKHIGQGCYFRVTEDFFR